MAKRRRTEIALIADPAARLVTFSKRRKGLFNKASELCRLCGARAAVVVFSPAGKPFSFGDPSADDILSDYLGDDDVMPPMDLTEWEKWVEAELDACATEEELEYFISKYEAVRDFAQEDEDDDDDDMMNWSRTGRHRLVGMTSETSQMCGRENLVASARNKIGRLQTCKLILKST